MKQHRTIWVDYLRSTLTVLVVAHHSALAYTTFARFDHAVYSNSTAPVVDSRRAIWLDIFQNFNDVFFMSLMFLVGGLFLPVSLSRKKAASFVFDRIRRLFVPFLIPGTLLMLIAYFPSYLLARGDTNAGRHLYDFFTVERWPVGPPWFLWVLFVFNVLYVLLDPFFRRKRQEGTAFLNRLAGKPLLTFLLFWGATWLLYVPLAYNVGAGTWTGVGPFDFQLSRILLYFGYFMLGCFIGNTDFDSGLFSPQSAVVKYGWTWVALALTVYTILSIGSGVLERMVKTGKLAEFPAWMIYYSFYAASCVLSSMAFLTFFRKFVHTPRRFGTSLSENAYLIYLVHYIFVTWTQFLLLDAALPATFKFLICFSVSLLLSWGTSHWLRKIAVIRRYM